uniref:Uncharacterized protein n=1 Tax=Ciona savignyi TaxID=51511 RepID=H2YSP5_CIOSA
MDYTSIGMIVGAIGLVGLMAAYKLGVLFGVKVSVGKPNLGHSWVAYKYYSGSYENCGPQFSSTGKDFPILPLVGICYDFDDKKKIKMGYIVGALLSENEPPLPQVIKSAESLNYKVVELPGIPSSVNAQFPFYESIAIVSAILGAMKVYPAISKFTKANSLCAYPGLEIYRSNTVEYMFPLSQQTNFFVPEAKE